MADRRVRAILEVDYQGEQDVLKAQSDLRGVDDAAKGATSVLEKHAASMGGIALGAIAAKLSYEGLKSAISGTMEAISHGADLALQTQQFDALAASIGTTGAALRDDLGGAMNGLVSNADQIAGASQLISLGLAKTHEEALALSEVSGKLNWDMQVLGMTIANQSTARLDSLGLSIDSVKTKIAELTEAGMSTDEAFKWAIIEAGRDKIEILGEVSDSAAGKLQQLAVAGQDMKDNFSTLAFTMFEAAGGIEAVTNAASNLGVLNDALGNMQGFEDAGLDTSALKWAIFNSNYKEAAVLVAALSDQMEAANANLAYENVSWEEYAFAVQNGIVSTRGMADAAQGADVAMLNSAQAYRDAQTSLEAYGDTAYTAALAQQAMSGIDLDSLNLQIQYQKDAAAAVDLYAAAVSAAMSQGGDYFTQFSQGGEDAFNFADALYATADAFGANLGVLSDVGVQYGIITEQQAAAATEATQTQTIMDHIAAGAQAGVIPWENYAAAVQTAIDKLHGIEEPQIARPLPDRHGGGDAYDENFSEPPIRHEVVEMEVQLQTDLINDAVTEARGIVEGFTDPAEAYEAIMSMNIDDVVAKAGTVQTLIEGIPTEKNIILHVSASGMHILEELRAVGAIP